MACCTSPTWPGSACAIRPKWSTSATSWKCACCASTASATAFRWASSSSATIPGTTCRAATRSTTRLFGKVTNITDYGCFVEIEDGVEGLVHVSEMDWTNKNVNPAKVVHTGDECEVMVLDIDEERRRISLGMKQCQANPWEAFAATHNKGDKVSGAIKSITDFGIFIGLEGGIDGLVHLSDISWQDTGEELVRNFRKGEELEAVVLAVDPERERISLGIKQLDQDPFATWMAEHPRGSMVKGTVKEVEALHRTGSGYDKIRIDRTHGRGAEPPQPVRRRAGGTLRSRADEPCVVGRGADRDSRIRKLLAALPSAPHGAQSPHRRIGCPAGQVRAAFQAGQGPERTSQPRPVVGLTGACSAGP
jgi:predicted RNA-binding protein with RPS1 domain